MVKIRNVLFSILLITGTLFFAGCDTETDSESPKITVNQPLAGSFFDNGDTIFFHAEISDNTQLTNSEVILVDQDNKPMLASINRVPDTNPYAFSGSYVIDDPLLPGGKYQLRFQATDGVNTTNQFVEINVHELERQLLYPLIVTNPENGKWMVYKLENNHSWQEFYSHTGDYCGSAINSAASLLYMCGVYQKGLTAVQLANGEQLWYVKPEIYHLQRWFEGVSFSYPNLYISCTQGNIRGYDQTGKEIYKSETYPVSIPHLSVTTKNFVIGSFRDDFSNDRYLVAFHHEGGLMIHNKFIQGDVAGLMQIENDRVLVFSNSSGQGEISVYNGADNSLSSLHPFYDGTFYEAAAIDSDNYLVSGSSGNYWYKLSLNSLVPFIPAEINSQIAYDNISHLIFSCVGKLMKVYTFPGAQLTESIALPDTAVDLHLVYNK